MSYVVGAKNSLYANPARLYGEIPTHDWLAPIPGWGMNPNWAGPAKVGIGSDDDAEAGSGVGHYAKVAAVIVGLAAVGVAIARRK